MFNSHVETGHYYEKMAAEYLEQQGYKILDRNYRGKHGEIDLIAWEMQYLVFVEVKYRASECRQHPLEAVTVSKQRRISRTALEYMISHGYGEETPCRFDVVAMTGGRIRVFKQAFDYQRAKGW